MHYLFALLALALFWRLLVHLSRLLHRSASRWGGLGRPASGGRTAARRAGDRRPRGVLASWAARGLLHRNGLRRGMRVLEIGIAGEAWSRALEGRVGPGGSIRVLAAGDLAGPLPLPDGSLDFIWMVSAVERLPDPCAILRECRRILAPAGRIALTEAFLDPGAPGRGDLVALLEGAGFRQVEHEEGIGHHTARGLR